MVLEVARATNAEKNLMHQCQSQGGSKSQRGLTRRLLKRVCNIAENDFVGGRFLTPVALRYDNQDVSRYTVDKDLYNFQLSLLSRRAAWTKEVL